MHRLARFLDPRNTIEGKIVSVILSVVLVFSMVNLSTIVENASAAGSDGDALFTTELATDDKAKTQTEGGEPTQNQVITDEQTETNTPDSNQPGQNNNGVATLSLDDDQNSDESNNAQSTQQQRAAAVPAAQNDHYINNGYEQINGKNGYWVFLYTKVKTNDLNLNTNSDGWFTIGKIWVQGINSPSKIGNGHVTNGDDYNKIIQALNQVKRNNYQETQTFQRWAPNAAINLDKIEWRHSNVDNQAFGLTKANGASDYVAHTCSDNVRDHSKCLTYHLDGYLDGKSLGQVQFKYLESGTNQELSGSQISTGSIDQAVDANTYIKNIPGYQFSSSNPNNLTNLQYSQNTQIVTFYYTKRADLSYTVKYLDEDGNDLVEPKTESNKTFGETYSENAVPVDGYNVDAQSKTVTMTTGTNEVIFNYTKRADLSYVVYYYEQLADGTLTTNPVAESKTVTNQTFENVVTENAIAIDGYVLIGEQTQQVTISADETQNVINFYYGVDSVSTDPANPGSSDGVPDMYQVPVNFTAVNGSVSFPVTYVTLYDADGNYAVDGTGYLTANQIAAATANAGYDQASLTWNATPSTTTPITTEVTYTATFTAIPVAPVTPVTPTPTPVPAGPGVPTPAAAAAAAPLAAPVATITDDATPLAAGETIDDEDTPLAAFDHVDCWVHWFILAGIILTAIYGAVVVRRRLAVVKDVDDLEDEVLDGAVAGATQSAPADNRQAI